MTLLFMYKEFNENLLFLLSTCTVTVPPLRERLEDIEVLSNYFLDKYQQEVKKKLEEYKNNVLINQNNVNNQVINNSQWNNNFNQQNLDHENKKLSTKFI